MRLKSFFLAAVAGLVTTGASRAADLPMSKGEAVEYVRVCTLFGPGYFYIPGSDTCLQFSGTMRALYGYNSIPSGSYSSSPGSSAHIAGSRSRVDQSAFQGRFQLNFDARTQTDYGLLRSFISIDANTGNPGPQTRPFGSYTNSNFAVDKAYIQFGGLTAGYAESQYAFYDNYYADTVVGPYAGSAQIGTTQQLAYTAEFGNSGLSATISIEDASHSRAGLLNSFTGLPGSYAGTRSPDIVGNLAYVNGKFDRLQIMAAAHQISTLGVNGRGGDGKWGFAVGAGASWEIPVLSGGYFAVEGSYSDGASAYTGAAFNAGSATGSPLNYDAFLVNGRTETAKSWSIEGEAAVNLTPNLRALVFGSYAHYEVPSIIETANLGSGFNAYAIGANLKYTVVKGFDVIPEVSYQATRSKIPGFNYIGGNKLYNSKADTGSVLAGVEVRRTF